jgi:hypothetical protein
MKRRGIKEVIHDDIMEYSGIQYDTLLLLMNGIGVVGDLKGLNRFLEHSKSLLRPGGQILLDSSDLSYLFEEDEEEGIAATQKRRYRGIIRYQMTYRNIVGDPFNWLYIDYARLSRHARICGYTCELLQEGNHYEYLARLMPGQKPETKDDYFSINKQS